MTLTLHLHSLQNIASFAEVKSITVNSTEGQITILPKHCKLVTKIYCNIIKINAEQQHKFFLGLAVLQVENNIVTISSDISIDLIDTKPIDEYQLYVKNDYLKKLELILNNAKT